MNQNSPRRTYRLLVVVPTVALSIACMCLGGCYKRVVGVQGPGSDAYDVYEPNLKEPVQNRYTEPEKIETKKYKGD